MEFAPATPKTCQLWVFLLGLQKLQGRSFHICSFSFDDLLQEACMLFAVVAAAGTVPLASLSDCGLCS